MEEVAEVTIIEMEPRLRPELKGQPRPSIKELSILIYQMETGKGAVCISNTENLHTFVQNLQPVHGKMSIFQSHNEKLTSSVLVRTH